MTFIRRLDHVAIVVRSTNTALLYYRDHLGLPVHSSEEIDAPHVRLTYLKTGNAFLQLMEPLDAGSPLATWLDEHGEGLHHICFGVDDVRETVTAISDPGSTISLGNGRGRVSSFVRAASSHGVRIECTEFDQAEDADTSTGWLDGRSVAQFTPPRS